MGLSGFGHIFGGVGNGGFEGGQAVFNFRLKHSLIFHDRVYEGCRFRRSRWICVLDRAGTDAEQPATGEAPRKIHDRGLVRFHRSGIFGSIDRARFSAWSDHHRKVSEVSPVDILKPSLRSEGNGLQAATEGRWWL